MTTDNAYTKANRLKSARRQKDTTQRPACDSGPLSVPLLEVYGAISLSFRPSARRPTAFCDTASGTWPPSPGAPRIRRRALSTRCDASGSLAAETLAKDLGACPPSLSLIIIILILILILIAIVILILDLTFGVSPRRPSPST